MQILDDDLIYKITYASDCKATFEKYKERYLAELKFNLIGLILSGSVGFIAFLVKAEDSSVFDSENENIRFFVIMGCCGILYFGYQIIKNIINILSKKLLIDSAVFYEIKTVEHNDTTYWWAKFKDLRDIAVHRSEHKTIQIPKNTPVYVVRTGFTKELLDIVPVDRIKTD